MVLGCEYGPSVARSMFPCVLILLSALVSYGDCWNLPNTYPPANFQGTFGGNRGYGQANAPGGSWGQGQFGAGPPGSVDQTVSAGYGNNQWAGDGRPFGASAGGSFGNPNGVGFGPGQAGGFGYNDGFPGNYPGANNEVAGVGSGGPSSGAGSFGGAGAPGSVGSFDGTSPGSAGSFGGTGSAAGSVTGGVPSGAAPPTAGGAFGSARPAGPAGAFGNTGFNEGDVTGGALGAARPGGTNVAAPNGSGGSAGSAGGAGLGESLGGTGLGTAGAVGSPGVFGTGTGFGTGGHTVPHTVVGLRPAVPYYGYPHTIPGAYGKPAGFGGYAGSGHPWYGAGGYVYRAPVAHINPDGSYGFSYQTPHSTRDEVGRSDGNVDGNYAFDNDGAKHNFSFSAAPDVDLRSGIGRDRGEVNPADYGPQSVHSRARLPLVPQTTFAGAGTGPVAGFPTKTGGPVSVLGAGQGESWSNRNGAGGSNPGNSPNTPDGGALHVLGLPTTSPHASGPTSTEANSNPNAGNQLGVVRNTATVNPLGNTNTAASRGEEDDFNTEGNTEDSTDSLSTLRGSFPTNDNVGRVGGSDLSGPSTPRLQTTPVEHVITRPGNVPSNTFAIQAPTPTQDGSLGMDGAVRGPAQAGPNDSQYFTGPGSGSRQIGGNPTWGDGSYRFGYQGPGSTRQGTGEGAASQGGTFSFDNPPGRSDLQYVSGGGTGFRPSVDGSGAIGGSASAPDGFQGAVGGGFGGTGSDGRYRFGYRAPDSEREEASDGAGNVRGSYAYNNEAGRNDLQYVAGAGTGFRATGGSLSVPNGLQHVGAGAAGGFGSTGSTGFGGTSNNRGGVGGQSFLPAGSNAVQRNDGLSAHNTVTRSPQSVLPPGRWNTGNGAFATTPGPLNANGASSTSRNAADESDTGNFDDTQQTTTFHGFDTGKGTNFRNGRF